ncbi:MAG: iron chelate uptake ABC transporter family permease subunit [Paracoccaceae bacterium]|jgi:manganese/zinc/iron transport system permease protein|nr:metal ABC transporter permease [Paracoccaceae bacterium]MDA0320484.1 metal ABC transporter permease [Pseudomonadota bacterium]MDA0850445.1 metal ABC transporter permease [Pseudomonadota bacterium]MDA1293235.1 metal ABC transporter permease [Pseudomonadota bacterium]
MLWAALSLSLGYNATLVTLGASLLGAAAGMAGTFLYLRKNALISDAISHATLPGLGFAFLVAFGFGIDGRQLLILLSGSALSAALGLYFVNWLTRETRLTQDTAIGCVLSVFFAFGVVLLTIIQVIPAGRKAGLESFLLGSTAGMLYSDALLILILSIITALVLFVFLRPIKLVVFDQGYSETLGISVRRVDFIILMVTLAVTVLGMKIVGLILIVALLIIPAVSARFWSERTNIILVTATLFGALSGYIGSAISAVSPGLPTGPIIVLCCFGLFLFSFLFAPKRGVLAVALDHYRFQKAVHLTQGLLSMAAAQPIYEPKTQRLLRRLGYIRADGVATETGKSLAAKTLLNEKRWSYWQEILKESDQLDGQAVFNLMDIETKLTPDQIKSIDQGLALKQGERM